MSGGPDLFDAMTRTGALLWSATWQSGLVAVMLLVTARFTPANRPALRHALLLLALLKFAVPPTWNLPGAPWNASEVFDVVAGEKFVAIANGAWSHLPALLLTWGAGSVGLGIYAVMRWRNTLRAERAAEEIRGGGAYRVLVETCDKLGVHSPPRFLIHDDAWTASVRGLWRPVLVLPRSWLERLTDAELRSVIAHELGHLQRHDPVSNMLAALLAIVWWFHPLFWVVAGELRKAQEDCADDLVLASRLSGADEYCDLLLGAARLGTCTGSVPAVFRPTGFRMHALARRLRRLTNQSLGREPRLGFASGLAIVLLGLLLLPHHAPPGASDRFSQQRSRSAASHDPGTNGPSATSPGVLDPPSAATSPGVLTPRNPQMPHASRHQAMHARRHGARHHH